MPTYKIEGTGAGFRLVDAPTPAQARAHATAGIKVTKVEDMAEAFALFQQGVRLEKAGEPQPARDAPMNLKERLIASMAAADEVQDPQPMLREPTGTIGGAQIEGDDNTTPREPEEPIFIGPDKAPRRASLLD